MNKKVVESALKKGNQVRRNSLTKKDLFAGTGENLNMDQEEEISSVKNNFNKFSLYNKKTGDINTGNKSCSTTSNSNNSYGKYPNEPLSSGGNKVSQFKTSIQDMELGEGNLNINIVNVNTTRKLSDINKGIVNDLNLMNPVRNDLKRFSSNNIQMGYKGDK
jgi:hypothetical protein